MRLQNFTSFFFVLASIITNGQEKLLVAVQLPKDSVVVFNLQKKIKIAQLKVGFLPHELTYDPIGKNCYVSNFGLQDYDIRVGRPGNSITVFNPWSCKYVKTIYTTSDTSKGNAPHGIKVRPGARRELYTNVEIGGDSMLIYDLVSYSLKRTFYLPKNSHNFMFSSEGNRLWIMAGSEGVFELNPENGNILHHETFSSPIRGLSLSKDWIVASGKNEVFLLSKIDLHVKKHFTNLGVGQILYSAITPDQRYVLSPAVNENLVLIIGTSSGKVLRHLKT